jgi:hypothetical protein
MRSPSRDLAVAIGAVALLGAVFTVLASVYANFATDGQPELNPAYIPPSILFACLAGALTQLGGSLQSRWANRGATATDPLTAQDLPAFKRLLKDLRRDVGTPKFAELQTRAAQRGIAFVRTDLELVTGKRTAWLTDVKLAEPVIRAFVLVHKPDAAVDRWLQSYRRLADPRPARLSRRAKLAIAGVTVATAGFLLYLVYVDTHVPDLLKRSNMTILSLYAPGRRLIVNTSNSAPPHARLGGSIINIEPNETQRWDLLPDERDGAHVYRLRNHGNERCLTPEARRLTEGIFLTEATCDGSDDQLWRLADGQTTAIASLRGDLCAEPSQGATDAGTPLILRTCAADRLGQRWLVTTRMPDLGGAIASSQNGICLDATDTADLITWTCHGGVNQAFGYQQRAQGDYVITSMGRCLAVAGPPDRRHPAREPCSNSAGQVWRIAFRTATRQWHYWEVKHVSSGLCLELEPDGRTLSMRPCTRSNVQQWRTPDWLHPPNTPAHPTVPH